MTQATRRIALAAAVLALTVGAAGRAEAGLVGTLVSGTMNIPPGSSTPNYFDSAVGFVPAGFGNSAPHGPSNIVISATTTEFGYNDTNSAIAANFTDSTLTLTDVVQSLSIPVGFTFTDPAFAGLVLTKVSDTFTGGLSASLSGTTLTLSFGNLPAGSFAGVFSLASPAAVPEPSTLISGGMACLLGLGYAHRRRKAKATA